MNGRLDTTADRPTIRFERRLAHPVERVWRALTEPEDLAAWFPGVPRFAPLQQGAEFVVEGGPGGSGRILELDAPRLLALEWGGDELRFALAADGDGCLLTFTHALGDLAVGAQTAAGWELCLDRLDAQLAGAPIGERESLQRWPELHERYAAEFGLDPELGRRTFAEHPAAQ
jgi:uncharacterized protein YndB with AHSA1/START domain